MTLKEFRETLAQIEAKYGSNLEFFLHGPEGPEDMLSGFSPAINWYRADVVLRDGSNIHGVVMHGVAIPQAMGPHSGYPVKTAEFPLHHYLIPRTP